MNKNNIGSIYCAETTFISVIPQTGRTINGMNEVTAMCTHSVNHQIAIHAVSPIMMGMEGYKMSGDV